MQETQDLASQAARNSATSAINALRSKRGEDGLMRLKVDFNNRAKNGWVKTLSSHHLNVGDKVIVEDPAENMWFQAEVKEVNGSLIYLQPHWENTLPVNAKNQ